jgi:hypothetical protein
VRGEAFFKQMLNRQAVTVRGFANDSEAAGVADYISEKNYRFVH